MSAEKYIFVFDFDSILLPKINDDSYLQKLDIVMKTLKRLNKNNEIHILTMEEEKAKNQFKKFPIDNYDHITKQEYKEILRQHLDFDFHLVANWKIQKLLTLQQPYNKIMYFTTSDYTPDIREKVNIDIRHIKDTFMLTNVLNDVVETISDKVIWYNNKDKINVFQPEENSRQCIKGKNDAKLSYTYFEGTLKNGEGNLTQKEESYKPPNTSTVYYCPQEIEQTAGVLNYEKYVLNKHNFNSICT